ncbi:diguanylate cyclase [Sphingomonas sp. NBWT7]|uniref:GGDEF domain-containing protein n=1 Tax=Sphingomonas sp. NBWT7 TaxID=2596913 RepID=UPI001624482D|nr:diguanylate cyclase [Sphingomonas sp. NBWT7]QNE32843.1 diguanylate cyclase [Sphingomonas sp. NBWT7]
MRGHDRGWFWSLVAIVVGMLMVAAPASAQTGLVGAPVATCVARVQPGDTPSAMLRATGRYDCTTLQTDFGPGDYWARSAPIAVRGEHVLRMTSLWQQAVTIWAIYGDGHVVRRRLDGRALADTIQLGAIPELALETREAPLVRLLWRVEGAANLRGIVLGVRLATPAQSRSSNLLFAALYGAFGGLCLSLLVYNLALWAAQRHRFQLAYCTMLAMLGCYAFSSSGAFAWAFPGHANNTRLELNYLSLAASAAAALAFARTFFEERVFRGWVGTLIGSASAIIMGSAILFVAASSWNVVLLDRLYAASFLLVVAVSVPILWQAWRRKSDYLRLFAYAWALPILLAAVRVAGNFRILPWSFLLDNSTLVAMAAEALLSSLAIAYRTRLLARERDAALEGEVAALALADHDPLTGLMNRRAFLREAIGRAGEQQLAIVDIDHFKTVNDTLGHDGGDEVLRIMARVLRRAAPPGALVARLGGEEFVMLAAGAAPIAAEALLAAVRAERMPFDVRITASLGIGQGEVGDESDWKRLYRDADQALFTAKAAGRDRARTAPRVAIAA